MTPHSRRLDLIAFGAVVLVISLTWLPTLTSGRRLSRNDDFLLHTARHEAVRKSVIEHHSFPLRSHWFGGGYPTLGEPEDPALNPLVLLSVLFGSAMGLKLIAFVAALASGLGTYALARYVLDYTRWGALFSALIVGTVPYAAQSLPGGNVGELCTAYLPLCMLLIGLSCRGRRAALFLLPLVLYSMLSTGKQGFFGAMLYVALFCLLNALPTFRTLTPDDPPRKIDARALKVLGLALGVAFFVGMARILPALEFVSAAGGLTHTEVFPYPSRLGGYGPGGQELMSKMCGIDSATGLVTVGWLPLLLLAIACCFFWKRALPWLIATVLFTWLALADAAPLNLFRLLQALPAFSTMAVPYKFFSFQIVVSVAIGSGAFFWLLRKARRRWIEHLCAIALISAGVGLLYPRTTSLQSNTYRARPPAEAFTQQEQFFSVHGLGLPRNRLGPYYAVTYLNLLQNVGTIDWYTAVPLAENAVPRYFVDAENNAIPNPEYRGEVFFLGSDAPSATTERDRTTLPNRVNGWVFHPNTITADVIVREQGVLVINQNYHPAWRSDRGELFEKDGLLAVRLREPGEYSINLRYMPRSFVVGLVVSALSLVGWALGYWAFGARRRHCRA